MSKQNGGIIGPDNVTTGGAFGSASGVFKLGEVTNLIKESKWPTAGPQGFQVANSYRSGVDNQYLVRNKTTPTSVTDFTFSVWVKRSKIADKSCILSAWGGDGNNTGSIFFTDGDKLTFEGQTGGSYSANGGVRKITTQLFRDVSAWSHLVFQKDDGAFKIYHNGTEITAFDTNTQSSGTNIFNNASGNTTVGNENLAASDHDFQGYIAEAVFIDGQALAPTSFGEFDDSGIWKPIDVSGLTFGNNGFYLDFEDSSAMGNDATGGTDFTLQNVAAADQSTDTCTNNFCTWNPLANYTNTLTFSEGNLKTVMSSQAWHSARGTFGFSSGKWYWECKLLGNQSNYTGVVDETAVMNTADAHTENGNTLFYNGSNGEMEVDGSQTSNNYGNFSETQVCGVAVDADNNKISIYKNGSAIVSNHSLSTTRTGFLFPTAASLDYSTEIPTGQNTNFGSPLYSESGGNSDGNGYGNFNQAVPSGYFALNTKNLAEYG